MSVLLDRLKRREILVADGALGTMLMGEGLQAGDCPEAIVLSRPKLLLEICDLYLQAGADILQTNTFGGSPLKLAEYGLQDQCETINRRAVELVREVAGTKAYVSASIGPTGKILQPYGDTAPAEVEQAFERQLKAILSAGPDLICIETMMDNQEAEIAIRTSKKLAPQTPVMATVTFEDSARGFFTMMGTDIRHVASSLSAAGADIVGSNCGNGLEKMLRIARELRNCTELPLAIQSNAGMPISQKGKLSYPETPEFFKKHVPELIHAGVSIIGGCCGTTPAHIQAIKEIVLARARKVTE
ncbi:MAG: homocysteine S-methyltransferase family protein [Deltaproteobacteria bacterium]|nr:homocysteine S-methyltransferase family protein [Deltaproteobacteria bacterium]